MFVRCSIFSTLLFGKNSAWEAVTSPLDDGWSRDFGGAKAIPLFRRRAAKLIKSICPLRHSSPPRKFMIWFTADDAEIDFEERLSTEPASSLPCVRPEFRAFPGKQSVGHLGRIEMFVSSPCQMAD